MSDFHDSNAPSMVLPHSITKDEPEVQEFSSVFLRIRSIAFSLIIFISLLWVVLLCLDAFFRWGTMQSPEQSLSVAILIVDVINLIMLLVLILLPFRPWLDAARFMFLFAANFGTAIMFTLWRPKLCTVPASNKDGTCDLSTIYVLIASWVAPALVTCYAAGLALMMYRRSLSSTATSPSDHMAVKDEENRGSILPMMRPDYTPFQQPHAITIPASAWRSQSRRTSDSSENFSPVSGKNSISDKGTSRLSASTTKGKRLSKRLPEWIL